MKIQKVPVYEKEFILYNYDVTEERGEAYMIKTKEVSKTMTETDVIICDACKKEIKKNRFNEFNDYYHIDKVWGYHSNNDGRHDSYDICEECYGKMLKSIGLQK